MKQFYLVWVLLVLGCGTALSTSITHTSSPVGHWKTIDDVTGGAKSIVQITLTPEHTLTGRVIKLFHDPDKRCVHCSGAEHNQPVLGLTIMQGLTQERQHPLLWSDGTILDPKNGHRYHCQLQVLNHGTQLRVRGYFGTPLFGRSQTWIRTE